MSLVSAPWSARAKPQAWRSMWGWASRGSEAAALYFRRARLTVDRCNGFRCSLTKNVLPVGFIRARSFSHALTALSSSRVRAASSIARPEARQTDPEEAIGCVQGQSLPTALQHGDLMAQGKILRLQRQPGSEARPQGMKEDANRCFHGMARLPAEGTNRNDFNAVGIIGMHRSFCAGIET